MSGLTSRDVAALAGVSQPTVSRALRGDPAIPAATRIRIQAAADKLGYVPSRRGRSLSTRRTGQIALLVNDLRNPFYAEATEHLHRALSRAGHRIVVLTDPPDRPLEPDELLDGSFDGVVLATSVLGSALPVVLQQRGLPVVLFNRAIDTAELDACVSDNAGGARGAAGELVGLGHRRIGAIFGPADTSTGRDREAGFRAGLAASAIVLDESVVRRGPYSERDGYDLMRELLTVHPLPSAVFCANDVVALGALNAAAAMGVAIPGDVSVIGFDDIAAAGWDIADLTTVHQDLAGMAQIAVELVLERVAGERRTSRQVVVPTRLIRRGSLGPIRRSTQW